MFTLRLTPAALVLPLALAIAPAALAQNPIQWQGSVRSAVALAQEQTLPILVWVSAGTKVLDDEDDLKESQERSFRDPDVKNIAQSKYVPLRVYRNSQSLQEMEKLGLPTNYSLYLAVISPDGKVLDQIDPIQVAEPQLLAARLAKTSEAFREGIYQRDLRPVIVNLEAKKQDVREALRATWRLGIASADKDVAGLLDRKDLTVSEKQKLFSLLAGLGTPTSVTVLLDRAETDKDAATALGRAETGALETLLKDLPADADKEFTPREVQAYKATVLVARTGSMKPDAFWKDAPLDARKKELERVRTRAEGVLTYWLEREGKVRKE